jgi:hypothetical protein
MRSLLLAILVAAAGCGGSKASGPAWPAPSTTAEDGGESIAPRDRSVATAVEKSADDNDGKDDDKPTSDAAKPASEIKEITPAPQASTPTNDDPVITDELIIEVDD